MNKKIALISATIVIATVASAYSIYHFRHRASQQANNSNSPSATTKNYSSVVCQENGDGDLNFFKTKISQLDENKADSILEAVKAYEAHCSEQKQNPFNDAAYLIFREFYYRVLNKLQPQAEPYLNQPDSEDKNKTLTDGNTSWVSHLHDFGFSTENQEGTEYLSEAPDFQKDTFGAKTSASVTDFLNERGIELKEGFSNDAALLIGWDQVARRTLAWEQWLKQYAQSPLKEEAQERYRLYLSTLTSGMDNSRIYDFESSALLPEIKTVYQKIIQEHQDTQTASIIQKFYTVLEKNEFKEPDKDTLEKLMSDSGLISILGKQPPGN